MSQVLNRFGFWALLIIAFGVNNKVWSQCSNGCPVGAVIVNSSNWNVSTSGLTYCIPSGQNINTIQSLSANNVEIYNYGTISGAINNFTSQNSKIYNCGLINSAGFDVPQNTIIHNSGRINISTRVRLNGLGSSFFALPNSNTSFRTLLLGGGGSMSISGVVNIIDTLSVSNGLISGGIGNGTLSVAGSFVMNSPSTIVGPSLILNKAPIMNGVVVVGSDVSSAFTPSILSFSSSFIQLCAGTTTTLSVLASANGSVLNPTFSYEWQIQTITNGAWMPITTNNFPFCNGISSSTLTLANIPVSASGFLFRVKVAGIPSSNFIVSNSSFLRVLKSGNSFSVNITTTSPSGICPQIPVFITATTDGNSSNGFYKWVRNGMFFTTNTALGMTVSGASFYFSTVTANNAIQAVFYDNCFTNPATSNGLNIFPAMLATWEGGASNDWFLSSNWKCGVLPNSTLDGIVPSNLLNYPQINNLGAVAKNIYIGSNASLSILGVNSFQIFGSVTNAGLFFDSGAGTVNFNNISSVSGSGMYQFNNLNLQSRLSFLSNTVSLSGDLLNNGTFDHRTNTLYLNGNKIQNIIGNPLTVNGISIENNSGVKLGTSILVRGSFALINGIVTTSSVNTLTFGTSASIFKSSIYSFVDGPVIKLGNGDFVFPVGKGNSFRPLSVTGVTNSSSNTEVEYYPQRTLNSVLGVNSKYITLKDCEYWQIRNLTNPIVSYGAKIAFDKGGLCNFLCDTLYKVVSSIQGGPWNVESSIYSNQNIRSNNPIPISNTSITTGSIQFLIDTRLVNNVPFKFKFKSQGLYTGIKFSSKAGTNGGLQCLYPSVPTSSDSVFIQIMEKQDQNDSLAIAFSVDNDLNIGGGVKIGKKSYTGLHSDYYDFVSDPFYGKRLKFYLNKEDKFNTYDKIIGTNLSKGIVADSDSLIISGLENFTSELTIFNINNAIVLQSSKVDLAKSTNSAYIMDLSAGTYKYTLRYRRQGDFTFYKHNGQFIKPN